MTTSQQAINALMAVYEEATDGSLIYAERAGSGDGTIDLGEGGLWSAGIDRLPSGTLLVVGPVDLDQTSWADAAESVEMACIHALDSSHRVAVLVRTPTPDRLCEDLVVLVRSGNDEPTDIDTAFVGVVTEEGELQRRQPFATAYPKPLAVRSNADQRFEVHGHRDPDGCRGAVLLHDNPDFVFVTERTALSKDSLVDSGERLRKVHVLDAPDLVAKIAERVSSCLGHP